MPEWQLGLFNLLKAERRKMGQPGDINTRFIKMMWVDSDYENRCSLYAVKDDGMFGLISLVFCNTTKFRNATRSIRLLPTIPCAIVPNVVYVYKSKFWNIDEDGYGKVLNDLLRRPNSKFPLKTNWERIWKLFKKAGFGFYYNSWQDYAKQDIPDYSHLWGICNLEYLDFDPDNAVSVEVNISNNMSIYVSSYINNILKPEDEDESGLLVFNDYERYRATKVARISIYEPAYLGYHPHSYACDKAPWRLSDEEKRIFIKLLKMRHKNNRRITNWQAALDTLAREGLYKYDKVANKLIEIENFIPDLKMPDYLLLPD